MVEHTLVQKLMDTELGVSHDQWLNELEDYLKSATLKKCPPFPFAYVLELVREVKLLKNIAQRYMGEVVELKQANTPLSGEVLSKILDSYERLKTP